MPSSPGRERRRERRDREDEEDDSRRRRSGRTSSSHRRRRSRSRDREERHRRRRRSRSPPRLASRASQEEEEEEDASWGPKPVSENKSIAAVPISKMNFGPAMPRGEGEAMANFVRQNERIPRRGEIGRSAREIEGLESLGYVMSGSRHKRMEAVRVRKEGQVLNAEERQAQVLYAEQKKREKEEKAVQEMRLFLLQQQMQQKPA